MDSVTINWPVIGSVLAAIAGAVGTAVTAIWGADAGVDAQNILQALSALLLVIPAYHLGSVAAANSKARYQARLNVQYFKDTFQPVVQSQAHVQIVDDVEGVK